jgi:hypothetical protein
VSDLIERDAVVASLQSMANAQRDEGTSAASIRADAFDYAAEMLKRLVMPSCPPQTQTMEALPALAWAAYEYRREHLALCAMPTAAGTALDEALKPWLPLPPPPGPSTEALERAKGGGS